MPQKEENLISLLNSVQDQDSDQMVKLQILLDKSIEEGQAILFSDS